MRTSDFGCRTFVFADRLFAKTQCNFDEHEQYVAIGRWPRAFLNLDQRDGVRTSAGALLGASDCDCAIPIAYDGRPHHSPFVKDWQDCQKLRAGRAGKAVWQALVS
jgi:hypothetical protein